MEKFIRLLSKVCKKQVDFESVHELPPLALAASLELLKIMEDTKIYPIVGSAWNLAVAIAAESRDAGKEIQEAYTLLKNSVEGIVGLFTTAIVIAATDEDSSLDDIRSAAFMLGKLENLKVILDNSNRPLHDARAMLRNQLR